MIKTCTYFWEKVATCYFADLDKEKKLELARYYLGKDEFEHLVELLEK